MNKNGGLGIETPTSLRTRGGKRRGGPAASYAENAWSRMVDHAPVGLLTVEYGGRILEANARAAELLGCGVQEILGRRFADFAAEEDRAGLAAMLVEALRAREPLGRVVRFELAPPLSVRAHLEAVGDTDEEGRRLCRVAMLDAGRRRRARVELEQRAVREEHARHEAEAAQRRFDQVANAGAQLTESLDFDEAVARAAGVAVPGLAYWCAIDLCRDDGGVYRAAFARKDGGEDLPIDPYAPHGSARVIRTGQPEMLNGPVAGEVAGLVTDPAALTELCRLVGAYLSVPLRVHGRTIGVMSLVRRGSERFGNQDTALALELARRAALAIDNARLYREAQDADRRKDEFLAMLGHELRNPLAAVTMAAAMLRRHAKDASVLHVADVIERQGGRLARIVDDLLDVSRVTRGRITLRRERVLLGDVLDKAVESTRPLVLQRRHELLVTKHDVPIVLEADPTRLEQVVVNLIANAAKYTDPGGTIQVESRRIGREAVLRVADNGMGIPRDALPLIFQPFTQLGTSADRTDRGLGIGLTLARSLVELHGGRITAESPGAGKGTTFTVRLPLPEGAASTLVLEGSAHPAPEEPARPRRVLVAEDNADVADFLGEQLQALGHEVRIAVDGPGAIDAALGFRPEIMLIDLGLPGLTGYDVARRVRSEPALAGAKLVAVTGYGGVETTKSCLAAGFDQHFTKPIREDALRMLLAS